MRSAFYTGHVRHRRYTPIEHHFRIPLFMVHLDLDRLDEVFPARWLWSVRRPAVAWFRREDHFGDPETPLAQTVRATVEAETGRRLEGPVTLLTHLRYFGYVQNPVSFYFCWARSGQHLEALLLEVTNTPWGERQLYVLDYGADEKPQQAQQFAKRMHVSPFLPMDMQYRIRLSAPGKRLAVHLENWDASGRVFDATLALRARPITRAACYWMLLRYPWMSLRVLHGIYLQAFRLWRKGAPVFTHTSPTGNLGNPRP